MAHSLTFILGGARSGKSDYAQALVDQEGAKVLFVATAAALDEEMQTRIAATGRIGLCIGQPSKRLGM